MSNYRGTTGLQFPVRNTEKIIEPQRIRQAPQLINKESQKFKGFNPLMASPSIRSNYSGTDCLLSNIETQGIQRQIRDTSLQRGGPTKSFQESYSVNSKLSCNSRNPLQRPLSVNTQEHLYNLTGKEEALRNGNLITASNFLQSLESSKKNVLRNMSENFSSRVEEIWASYLSEQKIRLGEPIKQALAADLANIKTVFLDLLIAKTEYYIEDLRQETLKTIFNEASNRRAQREYTSPSVANSVSKFEQIKKQNFELKTKLGEEVNQINNVEKNAKQRYKQAQKAHFEQYEREFKYKLNNDSNLGRHTLSQAIPHLKQQLVSLDEELFKLQKNQNQEAILEKEVDALQKELTYLQKTYNPLPLSNT